MEQGLQSLRSIDDIVLRAGAHKDGDDEKCFMETVAFLAREKHSDRPACVCPVLGEFLRRWNDNMSDEDRQKLKPYLRLVIGTAGDGFSEERSWMVIDWSLRVFLAVYCEALNLKEFARDLRALPAIKDWASFEPARKLVLARALALDLALALALDRDRARALARALDRALDLARALALALDLARALAFALDRKEIYDSGCALIDRMVMLGIDRRQPARNDCDASPETISAGV